MSSGTLSYIGGKMPAWSRNLPDGGQVVRLEDICRAIDYGYTASADPSIAAPKFLRITDIQNEPVPSAVDS